MLYIYKNIPITINYNSDGDILNFLNLSQISNIISENIQNNTINYIRWDENIQKLQIDFISELTIDEKILLDDIISEV